jgi:hypothetical protein
MGIVFLAGAGLQANITFNTIKLLEVTFTPDKSGSSPMIGTYFALFVFALLFQFIGSVDAAYHKNTNQVVAICLFNVLTVLYAFVQIHQTHSLESCCIDFLNTVRTFNPPFEALLDINRRCFFSPFSRVDGAYVVNGAKSLVDVANDIESNLFRFDLIRYVQWIVAIFMCVSWLFAFVIAFKAYQELGWKVYLTNGPDISKKSILI